VRLVCSLETPQRLDVFTTTLDGVLLLRPPTVFEDHRGTYVEIYNERLYSQAGARVRFVQDDVSVSTKAVLRGIHGDQETWKLVSCLLGEIYLVVLNFDDTSRQYGKWEAFRLSDGNRLQVLVPPRFGIGHLVLTDRAIFHYKQSTYYSRESQFTCRWNDPRFGIEWPVDAPILSERDRRGY
jgi:dTDP-4-dehydrorhamnose 3,5-epimerase